MFRGSQTVITPGWESVLREAGRLDQVARVYELEAGKVVTRTSSTEVRQVDLGAGPDARTVFIKKYWVNRASQLWKGMFRGTFFGLSKARREFENLKRLRGWQLDAPTPVAYGEERAAGWLTRSFLISEAVPQVVPLHVFIRERTAASGALALSSGCWRRELIRNLAEYTRLMHERRFVHHDYFWRNILLSGADLGHFFLIDSHKGRSWYPGEEKRARAKDLATLDAPAPAFFRRTERLRFFLCYLGRARLDAPAKSLLRLTLRLAEPMREKQLRRVRSAPL